MNNYYGMENNMKGGMMPPPMQMGYHPMYQNPMYPPNPYANQYYPPQANPYYFDPNFYKPPEEG